MRTLGENLKFHDILATFWILFESNTEPIDLTKE